MPVFIGIAPGEERRSPGIRVAVREDGEAAWLHGRWLDLGDDHAVVFAAAPCRFVKADGSERPLGSFPAWVVKGKGRHPALGIMTNIAQFRGGGVRIGHEFHPIPRLE